MFKRLLLFILLISLVQANLLKPLNSKSTREILTVAGKRRVYQNLHRSNLEYTITGPAILRIYSRGVMAKKSSKSHLFSFEISIDDKDATAIKHKQKRSKGVTSSQHQNHFYTKSALDVIRIEKGKHTVTLKSIKGPIVIRVIKEEQTKNLHRKRVHPYQKADVVKVSVNQKNLSYYPLLQNKPMEVDVTGPSTFELITRLGFEYWMTGEQDYRIQIMDNGKLVGTYYFNTVISEESRIENEDTLMPGKWRSCTIKLKEGEHHLKIKLMDKDRRVFLRMNKLTVKDKK